MEPPEFDKCVEMLLSDDPSVYEDGYQWLQGYLDQYIDELVQLMTRQTDPSIRARFVELIGDSRIPGVIPVLANELQSPHGEVRGWAYSSLLYFENSEASRLAEKFRLENPDEEFL